MKDILADPNAKSEDIHDIYMYLTNCVENNNFENPEFYDEKYEKDSKDYLRDKELLTFGISFFVGLYESITKIRTLEHLRIAIKYIFITNIKYWIVMRSSNQFTAACMQCIMNNIRTLSKTFVVLDDKSNVFDAELDFLIKDELKKCTDIEKMLYALDLHETDMFND
jgi:hypothetical protein